MSGYRRLIEEWLPIEEIGIECRRERQASSALPPLYFLHIWWARRPLTVSRAAILGALLPAWEGGNHHLESLFSTAEEYRLWFIRMLGIPVGQEGINPKETAHRIAMAKAMGVNLGSNPYGYERAFSRTLDPQEINRLQTILNLYAGSTQPTLLDPMAGGGSIPFEGLRLGLPVYAVELNPVAVVVLTATLEFPSRYGEDLITDIKRWADKWGQHIEERLQGFYPLPRGENALGYLWARTVPCPVTGKPVPLSPNWWLRRQGRNSVCVEPVFRPEAVEPEFRIHTGPQEALAREFAPDRGTVSRGSAWSPWSQTPIPPDYIKRCAQEGRMGAVLYALCVDRGRGREFRLPTPQDLEGVRRAEAELRRRWAAWERQGLLPTETFPEQSSDPRPRVYGMRRFCDMFSPRQLLALCTYLETLLALWPHMQADLGPERAAAVRTYLAIILNKVANYNSQNAFWDYTRDKIAHAFSRHDFAFRWNFSEMNLALKDQGGFPWALEQVVDAYRGLCALLHPARPLFPVKGPPPARIHRADARRLAFLPAASVDLVVVDPPYFDNVMYGELSDFFYVWLKRSVGDLYPDWFQTELVDKTAEVVANPAVFSGGREARSRAERDYLVKMRQVFRECRRVVKPSGAMVVMFTHRRVEAWNALALALLETGWAITTSWPIHTESEHSLHIARKNAARSTILLTCVPRAERHEPAYWDEALRRAVREVARSRARAYYDQGVRGVDLHLAVFGPVLAVLSAHWPIVHPEVDRVTGQPRPFEPQEALQQARQEVFTLRREQLLGPRPVRWDALSEWYFEVWDTLRAREVPYDYARRLCLDRGISEEDVVQRARLAERRGDSWRLREPAERIGPGRVDPRATQFVRLVDAVHTALVALERDGERACRDFLERTGLQGDPDFKAYVEALIKVIPRSREYRQGQAVGWVIREAELLERLRVLFFPDITPPPDPENEPAPVQASYLESEDEEGEE